MCLHLDSNLDLTIVKLSIELKHEASKLAKGVLKKFNRLQEIINLMYTTGLMIGQ